MKKVLYYSACVATVLMAAASLWFILYASNLMGRPDFIQKKMAVFKFNYEGKGLGFISGYGSIKGEADARILGWGYGRGLNEKGRRELFGWFSWTEPDGRIWFDFSSDIKLTERDIQLLTDSEWSNIIFESTETWRYIIFEGTLSETWIKTPATWHDYCAKEVEPDRVTEKLVCDKKGILNGQLARLKHVIPSISEMKVEEYLFSR